MRSEFNFDFSQGGMLQELCIRMIRTNLGVQLGTPDEPVVPNVNVMFLCMTTTPASSGIFVDNGDGTYTITLPEISSLADPALIDSSAAGLQLPEGQRQSV